MSGPDTNGHESNAAGMGVDGAGGWAQQPPTAAIPQQPHPQWGQQAWSAGPQYGPPQLYGQQPYPTRYQAPPAQPAGYPAQYPAPQFAPAQPYSAPAQPYSQQPVSGQVSQIGHPQPPATPRSRTPLWIGLAVVAVAAVAGAVAVLLSVTAPTTLDRVAAERGVEQVLTGSYGLGGVADVTCPSGREVARGATLTCSLTVQGQSQQVTLTFTDDAGTYEVSRPTAG